MTTPTAPLATAATAYATVTYPDFLTVLEHEGAELVLAGAADTAGFRPNIVLTAVESTAPLTDASATALAANSARHPMATIIAVNVWPGAVVSDVPVARWNTFTYSANDDVDVIVDQWIWATGDHHLQLTASYLPSQATSVAPTFAWIAASLVPNAPRENLEAAASAAGSAPLDAALSERVGFVLEDLSSVVNPVPWSGIELSTSALTALAAAYARPRPGFPNGVIERPQRGSRAAADLTSAGYADASGRLTESGGQVGNLLHENRRLLTLWRITREGTVATVVSADAGRALVLRGTPGSTLNDLTLTSAEKLPALLARIAQLRPAFPVGDAAEIDADALPAMIESGWVQLTLAPAEVPPFGVLQSPEGQTFRFGATATGSIACEPLPVRDLFAYLIDQLDRLLGRAQ